MALPDEKYLLFTTFKKDGTPVATPVWIAALPDGRLGFTTDYDSWKVKRLKRNPEVTLQPCSMRGEPVAGSAVTHGTAVAVSDGPDFAAVERAIRGKYAVVVSLLGIGSKLREVVGKGRPRGVVIVTPRD